MYERIGGGGGNEIGFRTGEKKPIANFRRFRTVGGKNKNEKNNRNVSRSFGEFAYTRAVFVFFRTMARGDRLFVVAHNTVCVRCGLLIGRQKKQKKNKKNKKQHDKIIDNNTTVFGNRPLPVRRLNS